ncbi:amino acid adenylation domain-containing protein [Streptomyces sp. NPDC020707]|uniref:amino acid adenylation domain-containing protein n=1 Tax=Streptomyces sp. NPDC020707 TaxID=3365084 RepID=UPI0037A6F40D
MPVTTPSEVTTGEGRTLVDLFSASVVKFPHRTAVSDDEGALTYAELDLRSNALAGELCRLGVSMEDRVGLYMDRSIDVFVAILGILKAGAAYVAVDPRYPDSRRDLMLVNSGVRLVLTREDWADRLAHLDLTVSPFRNIPVVESPPVVAGRIAPVNAAYVLFTSGTTGAPKAIVVEHRNVVAFAYNSYMPTLGSGDRTGQISSLSFDSFNFEMWTTLASGAESVVLPPIPNLLDADFQSQMRSRRISAMFVPTLAFNHIVREDPDSFSALRILLVGGDIINPSVCRAFLSGGFKGEFFNVYGPSETTTFCTIHPVSHDEAALETIPIGRPLTGVTARILTPELQAVIPGEVGELHIGGVGVARGYLDAPSLTEERFLPDPNDPFHAPLYRTGDLVRERGDGAIEFIGRVDRQLKIRGYRVEPSEVECALRRHPLVHEAAVLASGEASDRRLIAVVVLDGPVPVKELRGFAETELPDFMVPRHFIVVSDISADVHGKRDMALLQDVVACHEKRRVGLTPPAPGIESEIAEIWEDLLGTEGVGREDHFFDLGGHSMLAFRVKSRIERQCNVSIDLLTIMDNPHLADLARTIDSFRSEGGA